VVNVHRDVNDVVGGVNWSCCRCQAGSGQRHVCQLKCQSWTPARVQCTLHLVMNWSRVVQWSLMVMWVLRPVVVQMLTVRYGFLFCPLCPHLRHNSHTWGPKSGGLAQCEQIMPSFTTSAKWFYSVETAVIFSEGCWCSQVMAQYQYQDEFKLQCKVTVKKITYMH